MMLLVAMAISVAYGASLATEVGWIDIDLWFELATLIVIMLLGHWQEMKALGQARGALDALAELLPDDAERVTEHRRRDRAARRAAASETSCSSAPAGGSPPTERSSTVRPSWTRRW